MLRTLSRSCLPRWQSAASRTHLINSFKRRLLTRAHDHGPSQPPLLEQTIGQHFASIVADHGDRPAVISCHQKNTLTYDALDVQSSALARGLANIGVKKGDRVAVSLGNNVEFATATYALFKLGAILVPLNPAFNSQQVIAALTHLSASHLLIGTETNLPWKDPRSNIPLLTSILPDLHTSRSSTHDSSLQSESVPSLQQIIIVDNSSGRVPTDSLKALTSYTSVFEDGGDGRRGLEDMGLSNEDVVNIQFTSGTTSMPKAACLTHRSILNNGRAIGDRMGLSEGDVVCCPPPLFHCFGCILGYMATATHGSAIVFPSESFNPLATLHAVRDHACTALYGVPTMFVAELELLSASASATSSPTPSSSPAPSSQPPFPPDYNFHAHLRTGIAAGSSVPANLMRKLHTTLGLTDLTICYGMTETSPVSFMTYPSDPVAKKLETVGRLLPHVEAKIVDPSDRSRILGIGQRGELVVSGYLVMRGYYGDPARTAEVLVEDEMEKGKWWMHTGDEASMDEEGYVTITGRIKDLIIRGGENIHPLEVENCLFAHPGVAEVAVVGLPDERYGEVVAAFVVRHGRDDSSGDGNERKERITEQEVRDWVRERLSPHLVPKYVFWTTTYPKTASSKIQKFKLRELGIQLVKEGKGL